MNYPCPGIAVPNVMAGRAQSRRIEPGIAPEWLTACSYCNQVLVVDEQFGPQWISREAYSSNGRANGVQLTHGICPDCYHKIILPVLAGLRRNASGTRGLPTAPE
ncbi:MAG: hypothetical protein AUK55_12650 [Syntrophobacteraceae bacterium CG2_30_61_12]|nr:MAG: hypothetical protein AUK55_12650 [Syntrophobacteraceae bacterium CG2_30_61_12]PIU32833.1 MAG: hypothetical protein COT06_00635 [Syntrophobacteraceae bacterium CG07_land_8_20_14_0_80_61_8]